MNLSRRILWTYTFFILFAFALRLIDLDSQSIWFDEGWSAYAAAQPTLVDAFNADATNPPLYYGILHIAARAFGDSEFALRIVSLWIGLPISALVVVLARRVGGRATGGWAVVLALFSAPLAWASQEARMYTLLALLVLVGALAWERLCQRPTRAAWIALWVAELGILYAHNTGPIIVVWLNAVTLGVWLTRRSLLRPAWRAWVIGQIAVCGLYLPYFFSRFLLLSDANSAVHSAPVLDLADVGRIWQGLWVAPWSLSGQSPLWMAASLVALGVLMLGAARVQRARWISIHVLCLLVGITAGLAILGNELHGRYLVMIVPLALVGVAIGITAIPSLGRGVVALAFLGMFGMSFQQGRLPEHQHDDVRTMVGWLADTLTTEDTVLAWSYADRYDLAYYWDRLGVTAQRVTLPEGADLAAILPSLPTSGRVALNVWYTQRADFRGMMGCILAHGARTTPIAHTTAGMTTLVYETAPAPLPDPIPINLTFRDSGGRDRARIEAVSTLPALAADQTLCAPVTLTLLSAPVFTVDLKAALIVRNDLGWEIARADAVFATADQRTSRQLVPGDLMNAFPQITLPIGAPAGRYSMFLRLYDDTTLSGYEPHLWAAEAVTNGRDALIGWWQVGAGDWQTGDGVAIDGVILAESVLSPASESSVRNGDVLRVSLLWQGQGQTPSVILADAEGRWSVTVSAAGQAVGGLVRQWVEIVIPPDAETGTAILSAADQRIGTYQVTAAPMVITHPEVGQRVNARFADVGTLVGVNLPDVPIARGAEVPVTLIWRAAEMPVMTSYTVFVQLVNDAGEVIAQSDAVPAHGERPTTGWRAGEYIRDGHALQFNDRATSGNARLIAGLYDAVNGERLVLADGADFVVLSERLPIAP